jgi:hypothetical protein
MPAFCEALRNSKSLRVLELEWVNLWADSAAAYQLIAAIEGHSALHELKLRNNPTDRTPAAQQAAGECLARLIAQSSSLWGLDLSYDGLGEAGLEPFFQALRSSTGLVKLIFGHNEQFSAEFARDVVLPAVRANTSLRELEGVRWVAGEPLPAMEDVVVILEARVLADEEASFRADDSRR